MEPASRGAILIVERLPLYLLHQLRAAEHPVPNCGLGSAFEIRWSCEIWPEFTNNHRRQVHPATALELELMRSPSVSTVKERDLPHELTRTDPVNVWVEPTMAHD